MSFDLFGEIEIQIVSPSIIREAFNTGQFWERARDGEFRVRIRSSNHLSRHNARGASVTYCTHTQIVHYFNEDGMVAVMHQYRQPDGTLGASGKPDPKYLRLEDRILKARG